MTNFQLFRKQISQFLKENDKGIGAFCAMRTELQNESCSQLMCHECKMKTLEWLTESPEEFWEDVKVDTLIMCKIVPYGQWVKRYFAKQEDGIVYVWSNGCTSKTTTVTEQAFAPEILNEDF